MILLMLPCVAAEVLFDDWVIAGSTFTVDGADHLVVYKAGRATAVIEGPLGRAVLEQGACKVTDDYRFCFIEVDSGRAEYRNGEEYPGLKLKIERLSPDVHLTRSMSTSEIALGERADITVTLENTGDKPAFNVRYADRLPPGIAVVTAGSLERFANGVQWSGVLSPKKSMTVKYTIEAKGFAEGEAQATLVYFDGESTHEVESDPLRISVTLPFEIEQEFSPEDFGLNTDVTYKLQLRNTLHRPIEIDALALQVPKGMVVSSGTPWKKTERGNYVFNGMLAETETFTLKFRIPQNGIYDFSSTLTMTAEGKTFTKNITKPLRIGVSQMVPTIRLEPATVKSGERYRITATVENIGSEDLRATVLTLSGSALGEGVEENEVSIRRHGDYELYRKRLLAPATTAPAQHRFTLSGSYLDAKNQSLTFTDSVILRVEPLPQVLRIEAIPDHLSMPRDGTLRMRVYVTNIGDAPLKHIEVADFLRKGLNRVSGNTDATLDLASGERALAYEYVVSALESYRESTLSIKTSANVELSDDTLYAIEVQTHAVFGTAAVNPEFDTADVGTSATPDTAQDVIPPELPADAPVEGSDLGSDSATVHLTVPEREVVEGPGVFVRFWGWVKGIFGGA